MQSGQIKPRVHLLLRKRRLPPTEVTDDLGAMG